MALTQVTERVGVDASANNVGYLEMEPAIVLPVTGLEGNFRFKVSQDRALTNKVAGKPNASVANGTGPVIVVGTKSVTVTNCALIMPAAFQPPYTVISIHRQVADVITTQTLGGAPNTASTTGLRCGLLASTTEVYRAFAKNGTDAAVTAGLPFAGGNRDEFIAAVFDPAANILKVRRPRTNEEVTQAYTTWGTVPATGHRMIGDTSASGASPGVIEGYCHIVFSRVLSSAEIDAIYASAISSLAASSIKLD